MAETAEAKVVVSLVDELSAKLKTIEKKFDNFKYVVGDSAKKVGAAMTVTGGLITAFAAKSIAAAQEDERAMARLTQLTQQTTGASIEQINALAEQASAMQKIGVVSDDVTITGQSQLATFMLQTDTIAQLTPAMLDLAVANHGVNTTQEDMINIGNLLGKVMDGQTGALSKMGISFSVAQEEILKTGTEMERATTLSEVLSQNIGGLNESTRATSEGGVWALKTSLGDIHEQIGGALIPVVQELVAKIQPVLTNIIDWISKNQELTKMIVIGTAALGALLLILGPIIAALALIPSIAAGATIAFAILSGPVGIVIGFIAALIFIGTQLAMHWDWLSGKADEFAHNLASFFTRSIDAIRAGWDNFWHNSAAVVTNAWNGIKSGIEGGINWVIDKINGLLSKVNSATSAINRLPGVEIPQIGEIPALAKGGIVTKPTLALIGEAGPEAVVPLSRGGAGMAGSFGGMNKTTTINVYANGDNNADLISRLNLMAKML